MAETIQQPEDRNTSADPMRVMLIADSEVVGDRVRDVLSKHKDIDLSIDVKDGISAVSALRHHTIDTILIDIGDSRQNLKVTLSRLFRVDPSAKVVMIASLSFASVKASMQGLMEGAAEFIPTPTAHSKSSNAAEFATRLVSVIRAFGKSDRTAEHRAGAARKSMPRARPSRPTPAAQPVALRVAPAIMPDALAIGSSTGGPQALFTFISALPPKMDIPILITQHMPPTFTALLADHISKHSDRNCREGVDGEEVTANRLYLAPGDQHMSVVHRDGAVRINLDDGPPINFCRPSVDPLFESLASAYHGKVLGVVLTGMGSDGLDGSRAIVDAGGMIIAQDEATSVVWGMPRAVAEAGLCSAVLPLDDLGPFVGKALGADWLGPQTP